MTKQQILEKALPHIGGPGNLRRTEAKAGALLLTVKDRSLVDLPALQDLPEVERVALDRTRLTLTLPGLQPDDTQDEEKYKMAKANKYDELVQRLPELAGGTGNIEFFNHCMTRLRITVKNVSLVNEGAIQKLPGVVATNWAGNQLQVVIGQSVADVYERLCKQNGMAMQSPVNENLDGGKKRLDLNTVFDYISGSITPLIPLMVAGGCVKMVVVICELLGLLSAGSPTHVVLSFVGDAAFYFLPVFMGASTARKFGANMGLGMLIGAIFIHPNFIAALAEGPLTVFGLPIYNTGYSSTLLPVFLSVAVMTPIQKFFGKISPEAIRSIVEPFGTIMVMIPLSLCVLGPAGSIAGSYITGAILWLYENVGFLGVALLCGLWPFLVSTGMHTQTVPFMLQSMSTLGFDPMVLVTMYIGNIAQGAACAAVALKTRNKERKAEASSCAITAAVGGITEPAIFGISVPLRTPLIGSAIGGALGGAIAGIGHAAVYAMPGSCSFLGLPILFVGGTQNFIWMMAAIVAGIVGTFVSTFILYKEENAN